MATIEDFILRMKVEGQGAVKQVSGSIQDLKNDVTDLSLAGGPFGNTINGIINKLGPLGIAAGIAGTAFAALGSRALQISGEMQDIAGSTGIATGVINSFATSMIFAGGKASDAGNILQRLNQSVQEAASGNENLQKSFRDLGVFVTDANGKIRPTQDILQDITARFQQGELSSKQYTASIDILGKQVRALELSKLQAVDDPAYTRATEAIDKFNDVIDVLGINIRTNLVLAFGEFAEAINEGGFTGLIAKITESLGNLAAEVLNFPTDVIAGILNLFGAGIKNPVGLGTPIQNLVEQAKKSRLAFQEENAKLRNEKEQQETIASGSAGTTPTGTGGFGATPEADEKAAAESAKRLNLIKVEQERNAQLEINSVRLNSIVLSADRELVIRERATASIKEAEINSEAEIAKAKIEIYSQERLSKAQKDAEFLAKEKELQLKAANDIAKIRGQSSEALAREAERIQGIITQSKARTEEEERLNDLLDKRNQFLNDNVAATDRERERAQALFDLEEERLKVIRQISLIKDLPEAERLSREKEINAIFDQRREKTVAQQEADKNLQNNFRAGFERAYRQYAEDSNNAFETAGRLFQTVTKGMEDNFVEFAKTGKFEFKGFINSILEDLLRSEVRQLISQLFTSGAGRGGGSTILNTLGSIFGRANGGPVIGNTPYIVGERGPEVFVPNTTGNIMNNASLGGANVTYNINAVDAMSFRQMVASDPTFLFAVTEQGRRKLPGARL